MRSDMGLALRPHVVVSLRLLQYVAVVDLTTNSPVGLLLTATPSGGTGYGADGAGPPCLSNHYALVRIALFSPRVRRAESRVA